MEVIDRALENYFGKCHAKEIQTGSKTEDNGSDKRAGQNEDENDDNHEASTNNSDIAQDTDL